MNIADEKGTVYTVNKPDDILASLDNDELLSILKHTFLAKSFHEDCKGLIEKGILTQDGETNESIISDLNDGVEFLKTHLSNVFTPESIIAELEEVKRNMYGKKHEINDSKE